MLCLANSHYFALFRMTSLSHCFALSHISSHYVTCFALLYNIPHHFTLFRNISRCWLSFRTDPHYLAVFRSVSYCFAVFSIVSDCFTLLNSFLHWSLCFVLFRTVLHDFALYRSIRWHNFAIFDTANFTVSHCFAQIRIRLQLCRTSSNYPTSVHIIYFALFRNVINIPHSFNLLRSILRFISYQFALFHSALHYFAKFHTVSHCVAVFHIVSTYFTSLHTFFAPYRITSLACTTFLTTSYHYTLFLL